MLLAFDDIAAAVAVASLRLQDNHDAVLGIWSQIVMVHHQS
jgi:hypothetical protein